MARRSRSMSARLQGLFLIALLIVGAWQGSAALATNVAERRLARIANLQALFDGRAARTVNFIEAHYLPADGALRMIGGILRWRVFRSGGPQVDVGCDDWLFFKEELRNWPDAEAHMRERVAGLGRIAARLAGDGIQLVVAPVPDKARVEAGALCGSHRTAQADQRYGALMRLLRDQGIATVELLAPLAAARAREPMFYRTDTHWNQTGAAIASKSVAEAVTAPIERRFGFHTEKATVETDWPGDLLRLMSLDATPDIWLKLRPRPDRQLVERTVATQRAESVGLLDEDPGDRIVLLGSSYALNANFHGRLQEYLRAPVDNLAEAGGGFAGSANHYFRGARFSETPPRLIIWEFPERALSPPLNADDRALLEFFQR
ncbi:cell division protein FtsQ [Methylocystis heyeri]|uniref:Cell division protein FtsQ n=2 Tax=Methylocystis heyeri TaxID=391905 RepID=A0A6B8KAU1_9HYPH|nr:cell division protein FtsQ [Methylocystis heyeri]